VLSWALLALLVLAVGLLWWRGRAERAERSAAWDAVARALSLGFDPGSRSIRGKYRLLRLEITARRAQLGLGRWRTEILAEYEGVVPAGLTLSIGARGLRSLLTGGVRVSGHTVHAGAPGLLTEPEALRSLLTQLAELAKLLSAR